MTQAPSHGSEAASSHGTEAAPSHGTETASSKKNKNKTGDFVTQK